MQKPLLYVSGPRMREQLTRVSDGILVAHANITAYLEEAGFAIFNPTLASLWLHDGVIKSNAIVLPTNQMTTYLYILERADLFLALPPFKVLIHKHTVEIEGWRSDSACETERAHALMLHKPVFYDEAKAIQWLKRKRLEDDLKEEM